MYENVKKWLPAAGLAAALALAALVYFLHPAFLKQAQIGGEDLGGGLIAGVIAWLALRGRTPLSQQARLALGVGIGTALLLGLAVLFIS